MKKIYTLIVTLLIAQYTFAQWPANYGGVMMQAFYWNSFEDTNWQNLTSQADEIAPYFDLLWIPNSSECNNSQSMGYLPVYWLKHTSSFGGRERYLTEMINTYKEKGVGFIGDVVLNHKAPLGKNGSWIDFVNEERTGIVNTDVTYKLEWSGADICQNDDGGWVKQQGWDVTGANDTGDDFSGGRDLDHTSANVQANIKTYLTFLLKELGYQGFRLDMVKGYAGEYTKLYNEAVKPTFCVGEYWDGDFSKVTNWINATGKTSAVFDFPLKYVIRDAFGGGNWGALSSKGMAGSPDWNRYAVTFVDNHDTYENQDRLSNNVLAANALILSLPGTPCIFMKHWQRYPIGIGNMILSRKACGITNQSPIAEQYQSGNGYVIRTQGSKGSVLLLCGSPSVSTDGYKLICKGTNFAFYVSNNITVEGLREGSDEEDPTNTINVYVEASEAPYLYAWSDAGTVVNGEWPGTVMSETEVVKDKTFWKKSFTITPMNIIFNNGKGGQTADIKGLTHDSYFTYNGSTGYTDITEEYYTVELPECVKPIEGHMYAYFKANKDYDKPYCWAWNDTQNFTGGTWPGVALKGAGRDKNNNVIYVWDGGVAGDDMPEKIIFSNNGDDVFKTADLKFVNGGYYDASGLISKITTGINPIFVTTPTNKAAIYNLNGQRVSDNYRGLVIKNGRKYMMK